MFTVKIIIATANFIRCSNILFAKSHKEGATYRACTSKCLEYENRFSYRKWQNPYSEMKLNSMNGFITCG